MINKILLISPDVLPIPAVNGGAVETLIDFIIDDNEKEKKVNLDVISIYNEKSKKLADSYLNSKLIYIKINKVKNSIYELVNKVAIKFFNKPFANDYVRKIKKHLKKNDDYDLIVIENRTHYAMLLMNDIKCKVILHLHNDFINSKTRLAKEIARSFDEVLCISNYLCNRVGEVKKDNVFLIYNGIDIQRFSCVKENRKKICSRYNIDDSKDIIIYSARLAKYKGIVETIEAFKNLDTKQYTLLVLGDFDENIEGTKNLEKYIKRISKQYDNIIFTGMIDYRTIHELYSIANCGMALSTFNEPFCLSALEMLATGVPVIYTNIGGLPEVVGDCGFCVNIDDNLISNVHTILKEKKYKQISRLKCIDRAKRFSKEKYLERFWSLILK